MTTTAALLDPERQFLGCLLSVPLPVARRLLSGMRADDFADPIASDTLQLVIEVVATGHAPGPAVVFAHAVSTGRVGGQARGRWGRWLADTYGATSTPAVADHLKAVVLEQAWRREVGEHAARLAQAAAESPTEVLADLTDDTAHIDHLWDRYRTAVGLAAQSVTDHRPPTTTAGRRIPGIAWKDAA